ncbi:MAG TPA: MOSC domain-containing protein, partial [Blastocatellia bacterium]|nr:MOSC domain-containing protein [Blastocatellia bacterium]
MKVISVSVGVPREVEWHGRTVSTGIFKEPVSGRVRLRSLNLDGDAQADLSVHGGREKAVYVYPVEHYSYWAEKLPGARLPHGSFGENLTVQGLSESAVNIGDRFQIGSAVVVVTQPRMPCYKLTIKFGRADMVKLFQQSARSGFYLAVLQEGEIGAGDSIHLLHRDPRNITVDDINDLYFSQPDNRESLMRRALEIEALPE